MNHLMIDFETLDTEPSAVVLSLGAVFFKESGIVSEFYWEFDIASQMKNGRTMSADTLLWWLNQKTGRTFIPDKTLSFDRGIYEFLAWLQALKLEHIGLDNVWANDPDFDCAILENLIGQIMDKQNVPYAFYQKRSMRTFVEYVGKGVKVVRNPLTHHNALADAKDQAFYIIDKLNNSTKENDI